MWLVKGLAALCLVLSAHAVSFMSVDLGNENMKIAVVAPGMPMEIALNKESKRKTALAIAFRDGDRTFGADAISAGMRAPATVVTHFIDLLGKNLSHPIVEEWQRRFPHHKLSGAEHGGVLITIEGSAYKIEELVAQMLVHGKEIASQHTGGPVNDAVVTVPPYFTDVERRALARAGQIANLNILSLLSTPCSVALNYGMFRRKEVLNGTQYFVFYDMGAMATTATLVEYSAYKEKGQRETIPQLRVIGTGYDRLLGGHTFQMALTKHLADSFDAQGKASKSVYEVPRALGKLRKEAQRLKTVLSANNEFTSVIENVMEDVDLRLTVSRTTFEALIKEEVHARAWEPVAQAIAAGGVEQSAIDGFVIVGGATRIPLLQTFLQHNWGRELLKNINADEAAAMGAIYRAADIGLGFKVKPFRVLDTVMFPIQVEFERGADGAETQTSERIIKRILYSAGNAVPQKKVMTFNKHTSDFWFSVSYAPLTDVLRPSQRHTQFGSSPSLVHVNVAGLAVAFEKTVEAGATFKGIKAHFQLDGDGLLNVGDVEMLVDYNKTVAQEAVKEEVDTSTFAKIGETLNKIFGGEEDKDPKEGDKDSSDDSTKTPAPGEEGKEKTGEEKAANATVGNFTTKTVQEKIKLVTTVVRLDMPEATEEDIQASKDKLAEITSKEAERHRLEAARNTLEAVVLDLRYKLTTEEYASAAEKGKGEAVTKKCTELEDWIYDEGYSANADTFEEKIKQLKDMFAPIARRVDEARRRPEAKQALDNAFNASSNFLAKARESDLLPGKEIQRLEDLIINIQTWLEGAEEAQEALAPHDDPTLKVSDIASKITDLDREMKYLVGRMKVAADLKAKEAAKKAEEERLKKEEEEKKRKEERKAKKEAKANATTATNKTKAVEEEEVIKPDPVSPEDDTEHTEL